MCFQYIWYIKKFGLISCTLFRMWKPNKVKEEFLHIIKTTQVHKPVNTTENIRILFILSLHTTQKTTLTKVKGICSKQNTNKIFSMELNNSPTDSRLPMVIEGSYKSHTTTSGQFETYNGAKSSKTTLEPNKIVKKDHKAGLKTNRNKIFIIIQHPQSSQIYLSLSKTI